MKKLVITIPLFMAAGFAAGALFEYLHLQPVTSLALGFCAGILYQRWLTKRRLARLRPDMYLAGQPVFFRGQFL